MLDSVALFVAMIVTLDVGRLACIAFGQRGAVPIALLLGIWIVAWMSSGPRAPSAAHAEDMPRRLTAIMLVSWAINLLSLTGSPRDLSVA